ncbi:adenylyl-sulfate kinase [Buchnera aphidicola str. APS (Acyrthosiphon pisum)]|uniref:Adenylyl-sulfate kinase n=1 Tax=Buchnera aphidicola subsp. Acyrthosiphon pisum (strain APS) TaxID=107806 RepID=CYSC_BUCAI|nr:adenylyl-sulfate kinase [Buchnera aphidicola]P57497.1 RecName: Full=Adenylyl-sulfate kinase; AltName: Full=APS kinase; AltName: Full=ATP adenosine-5'-phosphosulfate 3'-phosphotransferase; AltName: Full=Adenosine-5'-phosphosulfate kinase [Buchnera aphidicola str. APS (Acyrthosiphon pisum)]pir/H84978/ adenylyl-sulfate kinase (EC 2.7.1.25) [imported] - Buchnera sp. (strain APS) [Buchnera sp. (in: enterobacteria)]BAB13120.1 adenylylsulfate kinase [Buchnera aphidicola str. APS (Acyrthosiphon pisum
MNNNFQNNIFWQKHSITRLKREKKNGHKSIVLWFTGLSGSGKSTIANFLEEILFKNGINSYLLDGDNIRSGLCSDLSFSLADRNENIRRIGEVVKMMLHAGLIILVSVISPYRNQREMVRQMLGKKNFLEVFIDTPIEICESRDPKKLYKQARTGQISDFTGIQCTYETPNTPDVLLKGTDSLKNNSKKLIKILYNHNIISFINID